MSFKMSDEEQTIRIYNLRADTKEFIGEGDAYIAPHTGLPADSTDVKPPKEEKGMVAIFDLNKKTWSKVEDHRGEVVIDIATQDELFISDLGPLPVNATPLIPDGPYKKWDGQAWVDDPSALKIGITEQAESKRQELLSEANSVIADWRTELQLDTISDDDKAQLIKWMGYIKELKTMDFSGINTESDYDAIEWPVKP